jgi:hypothetical protein
MMPYGCHLVALFFNSTASLNNSLTLKQFGKERYNGDLFTNPMDLSQQEYGEALIVHARTSQLSTNVISITYGLC